MARDSMKKKRLEKSDHIIAVATEVFSEKGYHGALTDEIADRAGISKRSMYYYIGDKDMLYEAVIKKLMDQVSTYAVSSRDEDPKEQLQRTIRGIEMISRIRPLHSIVIRELYSGGKNLPPNFREEVDRLLTNFKSVCERQKTEKSDVSGVVVSWMVFSFFVHWELFMSYFVEGENLQMRDEVNKYRGDNNEELINEVQKMVFRMLAVEQ